MEFVGNIVDLGAPTFHVSNICRAEIITPHVIMFSYSQKHILGDGRIENQIVAHLTWDTAMLEILSQAYQTARAGLLGAHHETLFLSVRTDH